MGSFDSILNNFKASYFAGALLMNEKSIVQDIEKLFSSKKWNEAVEKGVLATDAKSAPFTYDFFFFAVF